MTVCRLSSDRLPESCVETRRASRSRQLFESFGFCLSPNNRPIWHRACYSAERERPTFAENIRPNRMARQPGPRHAPPSGEFWLALVQACVSAAKTTILLCYDSHGVAALLLRTWSGQQPTLRQERMVTDSFVALERVNGGPTKRDIRLSSSLACHLVQEPELTAAQVRPIDPDRRARLVRVRGTCLLIRRRRGCRPLPSHSGSPAPVMAAPQSA